MRRGLLVIVVMLIAAWTSAPAVAQTEREAWEVTVTPYLMGAAMSGTTTVRGREAEVDVAASDIFSNLQFGAMGMVVARKGDWGFAADVIWMALGTTVRNTNVDFNQGAFSFYCLRRLNSAADLSFGIRVNTLQGDLKFKGPDIPVEQDQSWVDPIVGLALHSPAGRRARFRLYGELGGFGAGSDLAWQVFPTVGLRLTGKSSIELGYRWLDMDYSVGEGNQEFGWDMLSQGPVAGFAYRF